MSSRVARNLFLALLFVAGASWLVSKALSARRKTADPVLASALAPDERQSNSAALSREVAALRSEVALLSRQRTGDPAEKISAAPSKAQAAAERAPTPEERQQTALETHLQSIARLDAHMGKEARDPRWTSQVQSQIGKAIPTDSSTTLHSIECHKNLCRVELIQADRQALDRFLESSADSLHYNLQLFFERSGSSLHTTLFLAPEGQPIPNLANEL